MFYFFLIVLLDLYRSQATQLVFWPSCFSDIPSGSGCAQLKLVAYERLEGQATGRATGAFTPSMKLVLSVHAHILILIFVKYEY